MQLTGALLRPMPECTPPVDEPPRWLPRPAPSAIELPTAELAHRVTTPLRAFAAAARTVIRPGEALAAARDIVTSIGSSLGTGFRSASPTPFNISIGPHRRFDWAATDLESLKGIRNRHGGTVNDVVLAVLSGALGSLLRLGRSIRPHSISV